MREPTAILIWLVALACIMGCGPMFPRHAADPNMDFPSTVPPPQEIVPPSDPTYASESAPARAPDGIAQMAERSAIRVFRERGDTFRSDARLAALAQWLATRAELPNDIFAVERMARRVGFAGPSPWVFYLQHPHVTEAIIDEAFRRDNGNLPGNIPITRYGVGTVPIPGGDVVVIAYASVELQLEPVPKRVQRDESVHVRAKIDPRYSHAMLAITPPNGVARTAEVRERSVDASLTLSDLGTYQIELFGDGASGPVVLANFPVYVGVDEPPPPPKRAEPPSSSPSSQEIASPASVEQRVLELLAAARADAHLPALAQDDELAAVARAHAQDMAEHGFFGHVSPTTGTTMDRFRNAHLELPLMGENIAQGPSAEAAHQALMDSPGHRANMLDREYTHVGAGVAARTTAGGTVYEVTLVFAKRPPPRAKAPGPPSRKSSKTSAAKAQPASANP